VSVVGFNANGLSSEESHLMLFEEMMKRKLDVVVVSRLATKG